MRELFWLISIYQILFIQATKGGIPLKLSQTTTDCCRDVTPTDCFSLKSHAFHWEVSPNPSRIATAPFWQQINVKIRTGAPHKKITIVIDWIRIWMCVRPFGAIISHAPLQREKDVYSINTDCSASAFLFY